MDRKGPIIRQYLAENHFRTISDNTYEHIEEWLEWYQNEVAKVSPLQHMEWNCDNKKMSVTALEWQKPYAKTGESPVK